MHPQAGRVANQRKLGSGPEVPAVTLNKSLTRNAVTRGIGVQYATVSSERTRPLVWLPHLFEKRWGSQSVQLLGSELKDTVVED